MSRQAYSLDVLLAEVNAHAPNRNKASDGGLGDPAHAARVSDHNPNAAGVWRARDFTDSPSGGLDGSDLFHRLKAKFGNHPAMMSGSLLIHNRKIISYDRLPEGLRDYDGDNPHGTHLHISVSTAAAGYDNRTPWNLWDDAPKPTAPEPEPVPTIADCIVALDRIAANTKNLRAKAEYLEARHVLSAIADGNRVSVPRTIDGVRKALATILDRNNIPPGHRRRINAAYDLIRGI